MKSRIQRLLPDLGIVVLFAIISVIYCSPVLQKKTIGSNDPLQAAGLAKESIDFHDKTGDWAWWTNSAFGGMPSYFIAGTYDSSIFENTYKYIRPLPGYEADEIFWLLLGGFIFLRSFIANRWLAAAGAFGYGFCSLTLLYLEAGHASKIEALAFAGMVLAGIIYAYRDKKLLATLIFSLGLGLEIRANHLQITFYLLLSCLVVIGVLLFNAYQEGKLKPFIINLVLIGIGGLLAIGTQSTRLLSTLEYSKESMRGKSELTLGDNQNANSGSTGLEKDYAFEWSYGKLESFTFLIPEFSGGASSGTLPKDSKVISTLRGMGVDPGNINAFASSMPSYWGDQIFVSGPAYLGAVVCFLFLLGLFYINKPLKWALIGSALLLLILSWGKNLPFINYFLFDHLPLFNKFRSVNMAISLLQLFIVAVGVLGISNLVREGRDTSKDQRNILISFSLTGGIALILSLVPDFFLSFVGPKDQNFLASLRQSLGNNESAVNTIYNALLSDRESLLASDALRSFIIIAITAGLIFLFTKGRLKSKLIIPLICVLLIGDLWTVDKRYFNNSDFKNKRSQISENDFPKSEADITILADKDPNFRVLNTATSFWSSGLESYYHKSIGGYHGAKLKRAQEMYEHAMIKNGRLNMPVFNMLNTKYFIVNENNKLVARQNPEAFGNAWFVDSVKFVANANLEMQDVASQNLSNKAIVDQRFKEDIGSLPDSVAHTSAIHLTSYAPNRLVYESNSETGGYVVFSEMYYRGNEDWISYLDGKEKDHQRVNYCLRGMNIPAGKHEIIFEFKPKVIAIGSKIDFLSSCLYILFLGSCLFYWSRPKGDATVAK